MLFNSLPFVGFYLLVLGGYHGLARTWPARKAWLLAASWAFYATWSPGFLGLLIATTWLDFHLARGIHARRDRPTAARGLLVVSVAVNLGVLAFFKYGRFFYEQLDRLVALPPPPALLAAVAPLGVSFYTFHSISYVVDTYRGERPPTDRFLDFALYVAFFPQLIAGPISRWGFFGPQLAAPPTVRAREVRAALALLAAGYVKKVVCADSLGGFVDEVYALPGNAGQLEAWLALYAYAFQIYFDFSGYTDIAWGLAGLLGFRLPENFRHPYLAESPREFWRRWHISLSTWLRDYLYVPLGGSRRGPVRNALNLFLTMLLGGLWHGAAWSFVFWGAYHGAWLALHRAVSGGNAAPRTPRWLRRVVTFHLVCVGWVIFRAGTLDTANNVFRALGSGRPLFGPFPLGALVLVVFGVVTHALALRLDAGAVWRRLPPLFQGAAYAAAVLLIGLFSAQTGRFIYFVF